MSLKKPKLLLPAGDPECFEAALAAGADEIYLGGKSFNARLGAENFTQEQIAEAVKKAHFFGVSVFVTVNTLLLDREISEALRFIEFLYLNDVDALIITDPGLAAAVRSRFPDLKLHASTQCSVHNAEGAKLFASRGFSRVVLARECSADDIEKITAEYPDMEYETFVHGALCVCTSGMCELSAYMGGRSGNRGDCAQPCRLPDIDGNYRLSLKDNCLANHMERICNSGVSSLKVEGRMRSPEYVYGVGKIYRRLIDEGRDATAEEMAELSDIFSRSGFTDAYYNGKPGADMLGVRTDADKENSAEAAEKIKDELRAAKRRIPVSVKADIRAGAVSELTLSAKGMSATVYGDIPAAAITSPLTKEDVVKNLCKLGNTPFCVDPAAFSLHLGDNVSLPVSAINSLRRTAAERLEDQLQQLTRRYPERTAAPNYEPARAAEKNADGSALIIHFVRSKGMPPRTYLGQFSHIYLPIDEYLNAQMVVRDVTDGVELPPVVMQHEYTLLEEMLIRVKLCGVKNVMVSNVGTMRLALKYGFQVHGGLHLNVYNSRTAEVLAAEGLSSVIISPELNIPQMKALSSSSPVTTGAAVYGKLPEAVLEKCIIRDMNHTKETVKKCEACGDGQFRYFKDRTGENVPVCREFIHRNVMYNPVPIYMADKIDVVSGGAVGDLHFFFTDETAEEAAAIIDAYRNKSLPEGRIKRM